MTHLRLQHITDPVTGRTYAIPAGGADGADGGGDAGADGGDDGATTDSGQDSTDDASGDAGDDDAGRAGGPEALKADLARERQRRKEERDRRIAAERERDALRQQNETDVERAAREAREQALAPAIDAMRRTAVRSAATAVGFIDVDDALPGVDLSSLEVDADTLEVIDPDAVRRAVTEYAKTKPYLLTDDARRDVEGKGARQGGADHSGQNGRSAPDTDTSFMGAIRNALASGDGRL